MILTRLLTTFLAVLGTLDVHGQGLIWSVNHTDTTGRNPPLESWEIAFDHVSNPGSSTPPSLNPVTRIFSMTLVTNDTGRTFVAHALNEPGFAGFVAGLTDGANGYIRFQEFVSWTSQSEAAYLGRSAGAPDLAGYNITEIAFRVNNFYDSYFEPENTYNKTLDYSLDFYGAPVPEPSTWALLTLGAAAMLMRRKVRRPTTE